MATCFGLHFGSTNACIALSKDGKTEVVANEAGDRMTPAIVAFTDHDKVVGFQAKQGLYRNPSNTICAVKELIGRDAESDVAKAAMADGTVKVVNAGGKPVYEVMYKERSHRASPVSVAAVIFNSLKDTADGQQRVNTHNAVLCVPVSFTTQQQNDLIRAAQQASFSVLRIIREPCAALLAYGLEEEAVGQSRALVLRLGGRSMTVTIIRVTGGMFNIEKDAVFEMGGNELDDLLVQHLAVDYDRQFRCQCLKNQRSAFKLRGAAQETRQVLSSMQTAHCSVESLYDGMDLNTKLSRTRLEGIANPFVQKSLKAVEGVVDSAGLQLTDIKQVVVCGGVGRSPFLIQAVKDRFPGANILSSIPGDEAIALGAAKQASLLTRNNGSALLQADTLPCLKSNILLQMQDGGQQEHRLLFAAQTPMPARRQYRMLLAPEQTDACLVLCTADNEEDKPVPVAKLVLRSLPQGSQVEMVCHCRSDGSMHVTCAEPTSNTSTSLVIEANKL